MKLGDPKEGLILNIGGVNSGRYLKVGIMLEIKPDPKAAKAKDAKAANSEDVKILDAVIHLLRSQKVEDFDPSKQFQLKELIKHEVSQVIGEDRIYDVYITNFILQ
jgi:flagellar FliL protein